VGSAVQQLRFDELTVVIPTYRCERFLPAAIESALQSPAAHILIADDASGPELIRIATDYEEANPGRIRVLQSRTRRGTAININYAVRQVGTRYFAKLDGDDVLIPGWFESAFPFLAARPELALIAGRDRRITAADVLSFDPAAVPAAKFVPKPLLMSGVDAFRFILTWSPNPCSSGAIYRTGSFLDIGGFDPTIEWGEDWEIWLRFAREWQVAYCDSVAALYRIHAESTTAREIRQNRLCMGYEAVFRRAAEVCHDPSIKPHLRRAFLRVARLYAGAASREVRALRLTSLLYGGSAVRALFTAAFLAYLDT
jgi:glycosyltransferase involved in cell wall biosynthesis